METLPVIALLAVMLTLTFACMQVAESRTSGPLLPEGTDWGIAPSEEIVSMGAQWQAAPLATDHIKEFIDIEDPRSSPEQMRRIVGGGASAIAGLTEATPLDRAEHLDALLAAAEYLVERQQGNGVESNIVNGLVAALRGKAGDGLVPHIRRWLDDPTLPYLHPHLLRVLPYCGEMATPLLEEHDPPVLQAHVQPVGPYLITPKFTGSHGMGHYIKDVPLNIFETQSNGNWATFQCDGLSTGTVVYLAEDNDKDGKFEQLWPSRLRHCSRTIYDPEGKPLQEAGPPSILAMEEHGFLLNYGRVYFSEDESRPWSNFWPAGYEMVNTEVSLDDLRLDSDNDGLTDIAEELIGTDPDNPDSDGDGLTDAGDACPLSNPSMMGVAERAIARALQYFFSDKLNSWSRDWWRNNTGNPWQARSLTVFGAAPVDFSVDNSVYCANLKPADRFLLFNERKADPDAYSESGNTSVIIEWLPEHGSLRERYREYCTKVGLDPAAVDDEDIRLWASLSHRTELDQPEATASDSPLGDRDDIGDSNDEATASVYVDMTYARFYIEMKQLGGEYYPVGLVLSGIV